MGGTVIFYYKIYGLYPATLFTVILHFLFKSQIANQGIRYKFVLVEKNVF